MIAGMALATAGCLVLLALRGWAGYGGATVAGFVLLGLGIGMTMPAMTAVVLASAPREQSGIASGVLSASRQAGGAIGVALLGSVAAVPPPGHGVTLATAIAAMAFLLSCLVSCAWIGHDAVSKAVPAAESELP
jgi:DHA2 family methylenomycin A resistance protein-like MFS transporter